MIKGSTLLAFKTNLKQVEYPVEYHRHFSHSWNKVIHLKRKKESSVNITRQISLFQDYILALKCSTNMIAKCF